MEGVSADPAVLDLRGDARDSALEGGAAEGDGDALAEQGAGLGVEASGEAQAQPVGLSEALDEAQTQELPL